MHVLIFAQVWSCLGVCVCVCTFVIYRWNYMKHNSISIHTVETHTHTHTTICSVITKKKSRNWTKTFTIWIDHSKLQSFKIQLQTFATSGLQQAQLVMGSSCGIICTPGAMRTKTHLGAANMHTDLPWEPTFPSFLGVRSTHIFRA